MGPVWRQRIRMTRITFIALLVLGGCDALAPDEGIRKPSANEQKERTETLSNRAVPSTLDTKKAERLLDSKTKAESDHRLI